jgi:adenylate cyclase
MGSRVRITAQLIEAATGAHLWAERYDRDLADAFAVQDEITGSVVGAIEPELRRVEQQRAARKGPENMDAWDHYMRGMWRFAQFSPEDNAKAERLMRQAIELDPGFAPAYSGVSRLFTQRVVFEWSEDLDGDRQAAFAAARRAVELDEKDPYAHYALAWASLLLREHEDAVSEAQKSIDLTPNFALGYYVLGAACALFGRFEQAIDPFQRAVRLSPHDQMNFFFCYYFALAQYHLEHYEEAAKIARMGIGIRPTHMLYRALAASYGQLGRAEQAGLALAEMRRLMPKGAERLWEVMNPYFDRAHRAHFIEGLRKAGWAVTNT